ncbi:MAG: hypothetical protein AAGA05_09315 [Pseudomonadota bacterium]
MAFLRLVILLLIVLTVIYVALTMYFRARRREQVEEDWVMNGRTGDLDSRLAEGWDDFRRVLRRRLVVGVYVVPLIGFAVLVYLTNYA